MNLIHIVGRQNNGKTTLIVALIAELKKRNIKVGTLKHSSHSHELDKPGKDSFLHRQAGADPAAVVTNNMMAVYMPVDPNKDPVEKLKPLYKGCDLIILEGNHLGKGLKIEIWRKEVGTEPIAGEQNDIKALITDDDIRIGIPVWPLKDVKIIADNIIELLDLQENL